MTQVASSSWLFPDASSGSILGFRVFNIVLAAIVIVLYLLALWSRRNQTFTIYKGFLWGVILYAVGQVVGNAFGISEQLKVTPSIYINMAANLVSAFWAIMGTTLRRWDGPPSLIDPHGEDWVKHAHAE